MKESARWFVASMISTAWAHAAWDGAPLAVRFVAGAGGFILALYALQPEGRP